MKDIERLALAKTEILVDISRGVVPHAIARFAELHDYVDANWYGGLFDIDFNAVETAEIANRLQDALDHWLRAGRPLINPAQAYRELENIRLRPVDQRARYYAYMRAFHYRADMDAKTHIDDARRYAGMPERPTQ